MNCRPHKTYPNLFISSLWSDLPTCSVLFRIYVDFQLCSQKICSLQNYLSPVDKITVSVKG